MKILIATDGSDCSRHALDEALRLLPLAQAEVAVVGVTTPPVVGVDPFIVTPPIDPRLYEQAREETDANLASASRQLAEHGVSARTEARDGDPAGEIMAFAEDWGADLIVLGSHGRGALERLMLGSVSEGVLRHWAGAVLVARPPVR